MLRIRTIPGKLAYLLGGALLVFFAVWALGQVADMPGASIGYAVIVPLWVLAGARMFRGRNEPLTPPRPWWRCTETAGFSAAIAALFTAQAISFAAAGTTSTAWTMTAALTNATLAILYAHSALRLRQ